MKSSRTGDKLNSKCTELEIPCARANYVITQATSLPASKLSRKNARARGRGKERERERLVSLAQIGELARRLAASICHTRPGRGQRVKFTDKLQVSRLCQKTTSLPIRAGKVSRNEG